MIQELQTLTVSCSPPISFHLPILKHFFPRKTKTDMHFSIIHSLLPKQRAPVSFKWIACMSCSTDYLKYIEIIKTTILLFYKYRLRKQYFKQYFSSTFFFSYYCEAVVGSIHLPLMPLTNKILRSHSYFVLLGMLSIRYCLTLKMGQDH